MTYKAQNPKGELSYADILNFQEKIKRVKFLKKYINKELASLSNK
jgi:hypothetical protein